MHCEKNLAQSCMTFGIAYVRNKKWMAVIFVQNLCYIWRVLIWKWKIVSQLEAWSVCLNSTWFIITHTGTSFILNHEDSIVDLCRNYIYFTSIHEIRYRVRHIAKKRLFIIYWVLNIFSSNKCMSSCVNELITEVHEGKAEDSLFLVCLPK